MFIRVFYSNKCKECMNLWQVIWNEGINRMFIPVCLDNFSPKELAQMKSSIREIPAIVISMENQPSAIYQGPVECSRWLTSFTLNRRKNLAQQVDQQRRLIQKAQAVAKAQEGGIVEYTEAEMEGISDTYSYNDTELSNAKNYVMVGDEDKCVILTPQVSENKVNVVDMRRELAELENQRNTDKQEFMQLMEQNQIRAVINNGNNYQ